LVEGIRHTPPIYSNIKANDQDDRTLKEISNSDLVVSIAGGRGTKDQLYKIFEYHKKGSLDLSNKEIILLGWFGGGTKEFIKDISNEFDKISINYSELKPKNEWKRWHKCNYPIDLADQLIDKICLLLTQRSK
jgi:hypothetical protein